MKKNNNVKCVVCGKGYHLCMSCKDKIAMKPWKVLTDTSEHYKVHQVISGYRGGIYTKDEARVALENIDISDKNTYLDSVKKVLDEIGNFDENYSPAFFEDNDLKYRAILAKYDVFVLNKVCFFHFGSVTSIDHNQNFEKNRNYYYNKYPFAEYLSANAKDKFELQKDDD